MDSGDSENDNLRGLQRGGGGGGKSQKANKAPAEPFTPTRTLRDRAAINPTPKAKAMQDSSDDDAPLIGARSKKKADGTPPKKRIAPKPKTTKPKPKADDDSELLDSPKKRIAPRPTGKGAKPNLKAGGHSGHQELPMPSQAKPNHSAPKEVSTEKSYAHKKSSAKTKTEAPKTTKSPAPAGKKSKSKPAKPVSESEDDSTASEDENSDEESGTSSSSEGLTNHEDDEGLSNDEELDTSEEEHNQDDVLHGPKAPTPEPPVATKDRGGRPSAEKKAELDVAICEISGIVAKVSQRLDLSYDRVLDTFLDHEGRGANPWNIYQQYVVANFGEEILRLPESNRVELPSLTAEIVGRLFALFKKHCKEVEEDPGDFLRKWRRKMEIEEGSCSFRARTESFQSWFARVQRIMKEGAEHWSFDSMFVACGRIVNQDQSLCDLAYGGLAEDFFSKHFGVKEPLIQGHFRTHVFNEASRTSAVDIKKKILATKCDSNEKSGHVEEDADDEPSDDEDLNAHPTSKQQQEELELRRSLSTLLKTLKLTAGQKWKALPKSLAQKRYTIINWPRSVPLPIETAKRKGILGLSSDARKSWFAGLSSKDHPLSLVPWANDAIAKDTPVIKLVPEGSKKLTVCVFEDWTTRVNGVEVVRSLDNQWKPGTASKHVEKASKKRAPADSIPNDEEGPSHNEPERPMKRSKTTDLEAQSESLPVPTTPIVTPPSPQEASAPEKRLNKDDASAGVAPSRKKDNKDEHSGGGVAPKKKDRVDYSKNAKTTKRSPETRPPSVEPQPTKKKPKKEKDSKKKKIVPPRSDYEEEDGEEEEGRENGGETEQKNHPSYTRNAQDRRSSQGVNENVSGDVPPFTQRRVAGQAGQPQMPFYADAQQNNGRGPNLNFFPPVQAFPESRARSSTTGTAISESCYSMSSEGSLHPSHQRHSSLAPSEAEYLPHHYGHHDTRSRNISPGLASGYGFNNMNMPQNSNNVYNDSWTGHGMPSQHASNAAFGGRSPRWNNQQNLPVPSSSTLGTGYDSSQTQHPSRLHQYTRQHDNFHGASQNHPGDQFRNGGNTAGIGGLAGPGMNAINMTTAGHDGNTGGSGGVNAQFPDNAFNNALLGMSDHQGFTRPPSEQPHMPYRVQDNVFN